MDGRVPERVVISDPNSTATVQVIVQEANLDAHPTLDRLVEGLSPVAGPGWTDFRITYRGRIRGLMPVQAFRFTFEYGESGVSRLGTEDWYLLGRYHVRVLSTADRVVWELDQYVTLREQLSTTLDSFSPVAYTQAVPQGLTPGYSIALPPDWKRSDQPGYDYCATDADVAGRVCMRIVETPGLTSVNVQGYGDSLTVSGGTVLARTLLYLTRLAPSYRMDYERTASDGRSIRGATLITIARQQAYQLTIEYPEGLWDQNASLIDDIMIRSVVRP